MPLKRGKSPEVMSENIKNEMEAGKPKKQAIAIAYAVRRKNKMSSGGEVEDLVRTEPEDYHLGGEVAESHDKIIDDNFLSAEDNDHSPFQVEEETEEQGVDREMSPLGRIMRDIRMRHLGRK